MLARKSDLVRVAASAISLARRISSSAHLRSVMSLTLTTISCRSRYSARKTVISTSTDPSVVGDAPCFPR